MMYEKPIGIKFTEMAMWIDANAYTVGFDEEKMYKYLYNLAIMLAKTKQLFNKESDYEQFALYMASRVYLRLINKKQFVFDEDGNPKLKRIKSVLNYMKKTLLLCKVDFQSEILLIDDENPQYAADATSIGSYISDNTSLFDRVDFALSLGGIPSMVRNYLKKIPRKKDGVEWTNIYISCVLSLINMMTPINRRIRYYTDRGAEPRDYIEKLCSELRYEEPILYHLDDSYKNYIRVLVNELRHCIASELSWKSGEYINADDAMAGIVASSIGVGGSNEY